MTADGYMGFFGIEKEKVGKLNYLFFFLNCV